MTVQWPGNDLAMSWRWPWNDLAMIEHWPYNDLAIMRNSLCDRSHTAGHLKIDDMGTLRLGLHMAARSSLMWATRKMFKTLSVKLQAYLYCLNLYKHIRRLTWKVWNILRLARIREGCAAIWSLRRRVSISSILRCSAVGDRSHRWSLNLCMTLWLKGCENTAKAHSKAGGRGLLA